MIHLKPLSYDNIKNFDGTSYEKMLLPQKEYMIKESIEKTHNDRYFEILTVYNDDTVVGFMNLYAHSKHIISCGPEIKESCRNKGYGFQALTLALEYAKENGYTIAVAHINNNNAPSIALHEKLGFKLEKQYINKHGHETRRYVKAL